MSDLSKNSGISRNLNPYITDSVNIYSHAPSLHLPQGFPVYYMTSSSTRHSMSLTSQIAEEDEGNRDWWLQRPRHVARISSRRGPTWRGPNVPPTKNRKHLGFGPLFLGPGQFIFYFLIFTMKFCFVFAQGDMAPLAALGYVPATSYWIASSCHAIQRGESLTTISTFTKQQTRWWIQGKNLGSLRISRQKLHRRSRIPLDPMLNM